MKKFNVKIKILNYSINIPKKIAFHFQSEHFSMRHLLHKKKSSTINRR